MPSKASKRGTRKGKPRSREMRKARKGRSAPTTFHGNENTAPAVLSGFTPLFPTKTVRQLRYNDDVPISSTGGVMTSYVFSANGMYDPNITSTGHQPMGYDQIMLYYEHYHVFRCRWKVVFRNLGGYGGYAGVRIDADVGAIVSPSDAIENGRMVYGPFDVGTALTWREFSGTVNIPAVQGMTRANFLASEALRGGISSNPSEQTYIHCLMWNPNGQNMAGRINVTLEYTSVFTEVKPIIPSFTRFKPSMPHGGPALRGGLVLAEGKQREEDDCPSLNGFETLSLSEPPQPSRAHPQDSCFGSPPSGGGPSCTCRP